MSGILLISKDDLFVNCAELQVQEKCPEKKLVVVKNPADISIKMSNQEFDCILSDHESIPVKQRAMRMFEEARKTKSYVFTSQYGDVSPVYRDQSKVHIVNCPYMEESLAFSLGRAMESESWEDFRWGKGIKEVHLRTEEVLFRPGTQESAIYLVKSGQLRRQMPNGEVIDSHIREGQVIGELTYFERKPKPWSVIADEDSELVRISYDAVQEQLSNLPPWVTVMFSSLASRALKYSKAG